MRIFSTFSGIGGFEVGIQNAYRSTFGRSEEDKTREYEGYFKRFFTTSWEDSSAPQRQLSKRITDGSNQRPLCVGYSEIDKYAISVYEKHYPGVKNYGDITKINAEELPDFDCLVGGFPCQAFSIAGKRRGFEDTRGTLFYDLARILRVKRPRLFVFENVKGLLSHDSGRTFKTIISTITELGYDCQWQVLNSKNHGVPQNRERVIIVGHFRGTPRPEVFPLGAADEEDIEEYRQDEDVNIGTLRTFKDGNGFRESKSGLSPALPARARQDGSGQPVIMVPEATKKGYAEATVGQSINLAVPNSKTRRGRVSDIAQTLDTGMQQYTLTGDVKIRRLTPLECERLQGFPDNWTKYGQSGNAKNETVVTTLISDTQRYKMCGNAVTTNVIQAVFERIFNVKDN